MFVLVTPTHHYLPNSSYNMTPTAAPSNKEHLSSVPTLSHSTSESPSHPSHDGDTSIRISIRIYGGTGAAIILLVMIIVAVLACVLQQTITQSKNGVDVDQTNVYSQVYPAAGTGQYMI